MRFRAAARFSTRRSLRVFWATFFCNFFGFCEPFISHPPFGHGTALDRLSGRVSTDDMRAMNYAADVEHRDIRAIAADFLRR